MKHPSSPLRLLGAFWMQNFKRNPIATVASTAAFALVVVGLVFVSAFFAIGIMVLGGVLLVANGLLGLSFGKAPSGASSKASRARDGNQNDDQSRHVIEGDFHVVEQAGQKKDSDEIAK